MLTAAVRYDATEAAYRASAKLIGHFTDHAADFAWMVVPTATGPVRATSGDWIFGNGCGVCRVYGDKDLGRVLWGDESWAFAEPPAVI